jgi:hypothetical protein
MEIQIKADPTFIEKVGIPVPGKGVVEVEFTFKHRTKAEFEKFVKESKDIDGVEYVLAVASAWEFTDDFNKKNITTLLQNYHGAENAIATAYTKSLIGARLKN